MYIINPYRFSEEQENIYLNLDYTFLGLPYMTECTDNSLDCTYLGLPMIRGY